MRIKASIKCLGAVLAVMLMATLAGCGGTGHDWDDIIDDDDMEESFLAEYPMKLSQLEGKWKIVKAVSEDGKTEIPINATVTIPAFQESEFEFTDLSIVGMNLQYGQYGNIDEIEYSYEGGTGKGSLVVLCYRKPSFAFRDSRLSGVGMTFGDFDSWYYSITITAPKLEKGKIVSFGMVSKRNYQGGQQTVQSIPDATVYMEKL